MAYVEFNWPASVLEQSFKRGVVEALRNVLASFEAGQSVEEVVATAERIIEKYAA